MAMKLYAYGVGILLTAIGIFGLIVPRLISNDSDMSVAFGVIVIILGIPLIYVLIKGFVGAIKNNTNTKTENNYKQ